MLQLKTPISEISRIGHSVITQFKRLEVFNAQDLLFYFPARYDDLSKVTPIKQARLGERIVVRGRVELIEGKRTKYRKRLITEALIADKTGAVKVIWFNQPWIAKILKPGDETYLVGELKDEGSGVYFSSPIYERVSKNDPLHVARLVPVYASTDRLSQKQIRFLMRQVVTLAKQIPDPLPLEIKQEFKLCALSEALEHVHFPKDLKGVERARHRLKFDELLKIQLFSALLRKQLKKTPAPKIDFNEALTKEFVASLSFQLTNDQRKAAWEIIRDLERPRPMNRLLEGDVGSGKTVVVALAALNAVIGVHNPPKHPSPVFQAPSPAGRGVSIKPPLPAGEGGGEGQLRGQVAIMAPTEILARQHFNTFSKFLEPHGISVALKTSATKTSKKILPISQDVVIGTHALIQEKVQFKNLVLVVIDEQHRFGVSQRQALRNKRADQKMPHFLTLTATPIPRSLALAFYGDLDISILREMPKGRQKIETKLVISTEQGDGEISSAAQMKVKRSLVSARDDELLTWNRNKLYTFVREEVKKGHQVFWTCPIIDPSDILGVKAATQVYEHLKTEVFKDLNVGLLHGRMRTKEREQVMQDFVERRIDILVATPVIEVGIDVPNATVMVIEGAERFGLAQLHQFRGRVGRGDAQSYCLLMVEGEGEESRARARFKAFLECQDGFELAEKDLELRGPGEMYGMEQSGFPDFKIASFADVEIAKEAKEAAVQILKSDLELYHYPGLKKQLEEKGDNTHLE